MAAIRGETVNLQGIALTCELIGVGQRSDTANVTGQNIGFIVVGPGNVQFETALGDTVTLSGLTAGFRLECVVRKVMTATTADILLMKTEN